MPTTDDPDLGARIAALVDALTALSRGEEPPDDPGDLFDAALAKANGGRGFDPFALSTTLTNEIAGNVARLRKEAGLRQSDLGDLMAELGFAWTRQIVAEVERIPDPDDAKPRPPRRLTPEEMVGLVALLGVPMAELWRVERGCVVDLGVPGLNSVTPEQMVELIVGRRGVVGQGGPTWVAAASLLTTDIERPARQLWRTRRADETQGGR